MQNYPALTNEQQEILNELKAMDAADTIAGCYRDVPNIVYHHPECPGFSSTTLKRIVSRSYNHWFLAQDERDEHLVFGSAFHVFHNEPHNFDAEFIVAPTSDRKSAEWRAAKAAAGGRAVLTMEDFEAIQVMRDKLREHPVARQYLLGAEHELTYFVRDRETGILKKCRVDAYKPGLLSDLKSTQNAAESAFARDSRKFLTRISAAYYCEILTEHYQALHREFFLLACEKAHPWEIAVYRVSEESISRGETEVRQALRIIRKIQDEGPGAWKGYELAVKDIAI